MKKSKLKMFRNVMEIGIFTFIVVGFLHSACDFFPNLSPSETQMKPIAIELCDRAGVKFESMILADNGNVFRKIMLVRYLEAGKEKADSYTVRKNLKGEIITTLYKKDYLKPFAGN